MDTPAPKTSPKDVFLHLLMIGTLYYSAVSFITLLFQYINYFLPDPLNPSYGASSTIRFSIASLFVIFPVYIGVSRFFENDFLKNPLKRQGQLRKWLLYFTLFLAAITLIGDLVALIYNFLEGGLSSRFFAQVVAVGVVAGLIFWYYLWELRRGEGPMPADKKMLLQILVAGVAIIIIGGLAIVGSPFKERFAKADEQRIAHLQEIQSQLVYNYWQQKGSLPDSLAELNNEISGFVVPTDPATGAAYEYNKLATTTFELCATFETEGREAEAFIPTVPYPDMMNQNWQHQTGRGCFTRTIDPELYPVREKTDVVPSPKAL